MLPLAMKAIHQFVAGYSLGDAISNEAVVMRDIFKSWGYKSTLFSEQKRILPELRGDAEDVNRAKDIVQPDDVTLLHLSIGSRVNDVFASLPCRKAILYHNITPAEYFRGIEEEIAQHLARGREQAKKLVRVAEVNLADSAYNADEFKDMGCPKVEVFPLVLDLNKLRKGVDNRFLDELNDGKVSILFVGRCAPNKRIEDVLGAFHYFQRYVEPNSRLILAGSYSGLEAYQACLLKKQRDMQLRDVLFTGSIRQQALNACYRAADLFLCMSEHEGFCIPVIESMAMDVPVLAYAAAAVPGTMDGAGVLFDTKRYDLVAEMMGRMCADGVFREAVLNGQCARMERYESRDLPGELRRYLAPLIEA